MKTIVWAWGNRVKQVRSSSKIDLYKKQKNKEEKRTTVKCSDSHMEKWKLH